MTDEAAEPLLSEAAFAERVEQLASNDSGCGELIALLEERHPIYDDRGARATVRMRGWLLIALARRGLPDAALVYVLEELDTGRDPYLGAAAARALRSRPKPEPEFARYLAQAITNLREHDDFVSFAVYGAYGEEGDRTALSEVFESLRWLGPAGEGARPALALLEAEARRGELAESLRNELRSALTALGPAGASRHSVDACCEPPWRLGRKWADREARVSSQSIESLALEDQEGRRTTFAEFFIGRPSVVAFFYTRCDNPRKCSLTIAKMAALQRLLAERGVFERVRTAAITYDPGWDLPDRLRGYGTSRGMRLGVDHRLLRSSEDDLTVLRRHFGLGVNFIESLVNRHRVEAYVLDSTGRTAATLERLVWNEAEVADVLEKLLAEETATRSAALAEASLSATRSAPLADSAASPAQPSPPTSPNAGKEHGPARSRSGPRWMQSGGGTMVAVAAAFFPKCPMCWAAYLSLFGIAGAGAIPYSPWLRFVLYAAMIVHLASLWWRGRATGFMAPFQLASLGAFLILVPGMQLHLEPARPIGIFLTAAASILNASGLFARVQALRRNSAKNSSP